MTKQSVRPKYGEGTWFAVPLSTGGYAVGLIARETKKPRGVLFGYFFGPRLDEPPTLSQLADLGADLRADTALWIHQFGHLGLKNGDWPVIGQDPDWQRARWPMPHLWRKESLREVYWLSEYNDDDPNDKVRSWQVTESETAGLPQEGLAGAGFVAERLAKLLDSAG